MGLERFDFFLMGNAELVFFINCEKAEAVELHVFGEQPVCADNDVHIPVFQGLQCLLLLRPGFKSAQVVDLDRECRKACNECFIVLFGEYRCRNKDRRLP